jgi:hypothetical protein
MGEFWGVCAELMSQEPLPQASIEQPDLLAKTALVRKKNEKLIELIARTGISLEALSRWDEPQIKSFCEQAEINLANESVREPISVF